MTFILFATNENLCVNYYLAIILHSTACGILSSYFMSDNSICLGSPYLLFFCTFLPLIIEAISWFEVYALKKA